VQLIVLIIFIYAAKSAWEDARKAWRTSKTAYMKSADARFPGAPKSRRAAWAIRHDAGYWASQLANGLPSARHGFAAGWHQGRDAQTAARTAREEARTRRLENQADHAERLSGFRERQQDALRRWREAMNADRERETEGAVTGEGSAGSGEGSPDFPRLMHVRSRSGQPLNMFTGDPFDTITVYDADDLRRRQEAAAGNPDIEITTEPLPEPEDGAVSRTDCCLCGLPLAAGDGNDGYTHARCDDVHERDNAAHNIGDNRDLDEVEADMREQGMCPWQIRAPGWDGCGLYCGRPITGTGGDRPDEYCLLHQAQADGDDEGAAQELNEHVQGLLRKADRQESPASAQAAPSTQGEQHMASDVTYDSVITSMAAEQASAEQRAAEQQQAVARASAMADQMQGLEVDSATLSAMYDHLEAQDAASKAQARVLETAAAVGATLRRGHAGLAEAHQSAPVQAATRDFYQG